MNKPSRPLPILCLRSLDELIKPTIIGHIARPSIHTEINVTKSAVDGLDFSKQRVAYPSGAFNINLIGLKRAEEKYGPNYVLLSLVGPNHIINT